MADCTSVRLTDQGGVTVGVAVTDGVEVGTTGFTTVSLPPHPDRIKKPAIR